MKIFKKKEKEEKKIENEDVESENSNNVSANVDSANNLHIILDTNNNSNSSEDKKEKRKKICSWSLKITLLLVVTFLLCWSVYSFILLFSEGENNIHSYILLDGKNFSQSQNIYSSFAKNDQSKSKRNKINDYYLVGNQLFVSENNLNSSIYTDASSLSDEECNIALYNLTYDEPYSFSSSTSIEDKRYSIDLNLLAEGDYLIYSRNNNEGEKNKTADYYPYSINTNDSIYFETYSLPNKNGSRRKITIKNNSVSPYTVISSFNAGSILPSNYFDAVIYQAEYDSSLNTQSKSVDFVSEIENIVSTFNNEADNIYSIKVCSSINEARNYRAPISIAILNNEDNIKLCSKFVEGYYPAFSTSILENTTLINYDKYPDIREMFGLIDKATLAYKDVIGNNLFKLDYSHIGKESFILSKNLLASNYKTIFERTQEV